MDDNTELASADGGMACIYPSHQHVANADTLQGKKKKGAYRSDTCVIREHQPAHTVVCWDVRRLAGKGHLNGGWTPGDKVGELAFSDA